MTTTKPTLLIVAPYFPPAGGGLEQYAKAIADGFTRRASWHVVVMTSGEAGGKDRVEESEGYTIYRLGYSFKISNTPLGFFWPFKVWSLIRTVKPALINVHTPVPGLADLTVALAGKRPVVVTYHAGSMKKHNPFADSLVWLYERLMMPHMLNRATRIICSSDAVRLHFLKAWIHKSVTITPGVDCARFSPASHAPALPTLLFVAGLGHAEQHKGLSMLLNAMRTLRAQHPSLRLNVVGDGDMRVVYEAWAKERGVSDAVAFRGRLNGDALADAYRNASIFVLPTTNDSSPMVVTEAMASGLPVVSTRVGGIPSIVLHGQTGTLIEPHDESALVQAIEELLENPWSAAEFGTAGRARATTHFSWEERLTAYEAELQNARDRAYEIVHVVGYYPPHMGGMERVAEVLASMMASRGTTVRVLTSAEGATPGVERTERSEVRRLWSFEFGHTPVTPLLPWHLLTLPRSSVIHLHLAQAWYPEWVWFAALLRGIPYVVHFHLDVEPSGRLGRLFLIYKRIVWPLVLQHAKSVVVMTPEQSELVSRKFGVAHERLVVIPNGVPDAYFVGRTKAQSGKLRALSVGRFTVQKRVERLIDAFALIRTPATLTIVGDGEDRAALETRAKEKRSKVTFVGTKTPEEVAALMQEHDVFLISSDREGMPLTVLEAMAAGLPIIGSDVIGIRDIVADTGILVREPYGPAFAAKVDELFANTKLRDKLSAQSRARVEGLRWSSIAPLYEALYARHAS